MASLDNTSVKPFGGYNKCSVDLLVSIHFPSPLTMLGFPSTLLLKHWLCLLGYVKQKLYVSTSCVLIQLLQTNSLIQPAGLTPALTSSGWPPLPLLSPLTNTFLPSSLLSLMPGKSFPSVATKPPC